MKPFLFYTYVCAQLFCVLVGFTCALQAQPSDQVPASAPPSATQVTPPVEESKVADAPLDHYPLASVVAEAQATAAKLETFQTQNAWSNFYHTIEGSFQDLINSAKDRVLVTNSVLNQTISLEALQTELTYWQGVHKKLGDWSRETNKHQTELKSHQAGLEELEQKWRKTQEIASHESAQKEILERTAKIVSELASARAQAVYYTKLAVDWQAKIAAEDIKALDTLKALDNAKDRAFKSFFTRDTPAIWDMAAFRIQRAQLLERSTVDLQSQFVELIEYTETHLGMLWWHLGLPWLLYLGLRYIQRHQEIWVKSDAGLADYQEIYAMSKSTALILSLIMSLIMAFSAPPLFRVLWGLFTLAPTVYLLHRITERPLWHLLRALVVFYTCELILSAIVNLPLIARGLFLAELAGGVLFCSWFLRTKISTDFKATTRGKLTIAAVRLSLFTFVMAGVANMLGFGAFASFLASALLRSIFVAVCLKALLHILRAVFAALLHLPPLNLLRAVKRNRALVRQKFEAFLRFTAVTYWIFVALELISIRKPVFARISLITNSPIQLGDTNINLGAIFSFICAIIASIYVSRFVRFLLEEDLYPRVKLARGVPYAVSTVLHYVILFIGFILAVAALGYDMTKFTILAGAFGVGLGFGMQNIVNNFVSGLIVLFERPIQVGDVVQIDSISGTVSRIGIRATVIRVGDGSEVVVPNGKLISDRFTNWTLSDRKKRLSIFVLVRDNASPDQVMKLLVECAKEHPLVGSLPSPQAYLIEFVSNSAGHTGMKFELAAWTNNLDDGKKLQSELTICIRQGLTQLGIELL